MNARAKRLVFCAVLLVLNAVSSGNVRAVQGAIHPDLVEAEARLARSRGPEVYSALRNVWGTYNRADPLQVEAALRNAAQSSQLSPSQRAYAELLVAHARTRRGDLARARQIVRDLGFVQDWLIVGPFDNEGKAGYDFEYGPEAEFGSAVTPGRAYSGKERRAVRWREVSGAFPNGWLVTGSLMRPEKNICVYAKTFVEHKSAKDRLATLWVGSGGAFKLYWNGERVLADAAYRGADTDRFAATVRLRAGKNDLTLKLCGESAAPLASVRVTSASGASDPDVSYSVDLGASQAAAELVTRLKGKAGKPPRQTLSGPVREFELMLSKRPSPELREAFARYLVDTNGDDPTIHQARDLARAAADESPTVARLLLAGELAEGRNQRAEWIRRAEATLPRDAHAERELLLAQAKLARESLNWREAFPYFDRVLRLDPDDVDAIRGRVELYNEAGLHRTALEFLAGAVDRSPTSVALLNMHASQLRALGRGAEADAVETRYFALRFDDRGFIAKKLDLALKRRDRAAVQGWLDRLLALDPDSLWAHDVAATAYRALGQPERAVAAYQRALALAPDDVGSLRSLADLYGELGNRDEQLRLLQQILVIQPQAKDVREYVEHLEPAAPRKDEAYAWEADRFLGERQLPGNGEPQRTLLDLTTTTVFPNGLSSEFRQVVYQPLTDSAAALARQYSFQYQADSQRVQLRGAKVYRADGGIDEAIESGEAAANDPSIAMYTSARTFYVQLPRLEPGDVVELRYRIDDVAVRNEFNDYFGDIHYMGSNEPVHHARYVLISPKERELFFDIQRVPGIKRSTKADGAEVIHSFAADGLEAIAPEPAMPPWPEVAGLIHVSTYRSYEDLGRWYWGLAKDQFDLDDETRKLARDITKGLTTEREKVTAVYDWVIQNTRYVALEFGIYGFKPRRCVQTVSRGWGDCKDKATVIVTLLQELGIESTIVILRTGIRGRFDSSVASLAPFDHAIAYVPSLDIYLDGTAEYTGSGELPMFDSEGLGILVNQGNSKLVHLPKIDPASNTNQRTVHARVQRDGAAALVLEFEQRGSGASFSRRRYHAKGTQRERVAEDLVNEFPGLELAPGAQGVSTNDLEDVEQPVHIEARGQSRSFARLEGNGRLSMAVTVNDRLTGTYASLSSRRLDVQIHPFATETAHHVVELPAGMRVISGPANVDVKHRFGAYSVQLTKKGGHVEVTSSLRVDVTRVKPSEYAEWRAFCEAADAALGPRLVIGE